MRQDDWITKLYITERMKKKKIEVPAQLGWCIPDESAGVDDFGVPNDYIVGWKNNDENLTETQCLLVSDVVSKETKFVESTISDEEFYKIYSYKL